MKAHLPKTRECIEGPEAVQRFAILMKRVLTTLPPRRKAQRTGGPKRPPDKRQAG